MSETWERVYVCIENDWSNYLVNSSANFVAILHRSIAGEKLTFVIVAIENNAKEIT